MAILQERPVKGARISTFYPVKTLPPLASLDSAFQLQEYISLLIRLDVHDVERIVSVPGRHGGKEREGSDDMRGEDREEKDSKGAVAVDEACWVYEQLRRLAQDLSHPLITTLQQECTRQTCPEMKAGEWLYLCVAHGNDGSMEQCCAIDYTLHTLDSAIALLNSPRAFPSRMAIPPISQRHFPSLARRLGRIFAHAYYHHREAFEQAEAESSLYERFLVLTSKFKLVPAEFLVIPPRMQAIHEEREREYGREGENHEELSMQETRQPAMEHEGKQWEPLQDSQSIIGLTLESRTGGSPPGPEGPARDQNPRKGRSRTDTMVYSEAANVVEELSKSESYSEADLDRAIAQERMLATVESGFEEPVAAQPQAESTSLTEQEPVQNTLQFPDADVPPDVQMKILIKQMQSGEPDTDVPSTEPELPEEHPEEINVVISESTDASASALEDESTIPIPEENEVSPEEPESIIVAEAAVEVAPETEPAIEEPEEQPAEAPTPDETGVEEVPIVQETKEEQEKAAEPDAAPTAHQEAVTEAEENHASGESGTEEALAASQEHSPVSDDNQVAETHDAPPADVQEHHPEPEL